MSNTVEIINNRLNEYAGFDLREIYKISKFVRVFGGAIRDSISEREIYDIDILVEKRATDICSDILLQNGYKKSEILSGKDLSAMYKTVSVINEPHTWIKGDKIIQIITPTVSAYSGYSYEVTYKSILQGVDIRCCGVSFDGNRLYENYINAIEDCQLGLLKIIRENIMQESNRTMGRIIKLENRGWVSSENNIKIKRNKKLRKVIGSEKIEYTTEYSKTNANKNPITNDNFPF